MRHGINLAVSLGLAAFAMVLAVPQADAPHPEFTYRAYVTGIKKVFPASIMGIRGDATVLKLPVVG